jgi:hypothetical protein
LVPSSLKKISDGAVSSAATDLNTPLYSQEFISTTERIEFIPAISVRPIEIVPRTSSVDCGFVVFIPTLIFVAS